MSLNILKYFINFKTLFFIETLLNYSNLKNPINYLINSLP